VPVCPFKRLTGLPCLSCGTTRAALALLRGDLAVAFHFNPLATALGAAFAAGGVLAPVWALLRWPVPDALPAATPVRRGLGIALLLAAWGWQVIRGI
jgi:1,6-anhydro-N-acetylmuramate kinase